jgi:ABC-type multidrug transport system fused ATPase/permease subunit
MTYHLITFWNVVATTFSLFFFIAYLFILFQIITDLFRDDKLNGFFKAAWIIFLLFIPLVTSLIYILIRGKGMTERKRTHARKMNAAVQAMVGHSPVEQIIESKKLWDEGIITESEYKQLKNRALT